MIIEGQFFQNKPHGDVEIIYPNQDKYKGNVNMGIREGQGIQIMH
jgi:hypothetical protein